MAHLTVRALLVSSTLLAPLAARTQGDDALERAAARGPVAREALVRARAVLEGWWALRDPVTGLLPRRTDQPVWAPADNAADMFPFLVLTARFTAPERLEELRRLGRDELRLTTRLDGLPDWYSIPERRFLHASPDLPRLIFGATEYAKDGLNPLLELLGPDPWLSRVRQLVDGVWAHAPVASDFGPLPAGDTEVNGEMMQVLARLHFATGELRYLELAERLGDAYCLEVLPQGGGLPAHRWDFAAHRPLSDVLSLNDHGNEILGGLAEVFAAASDRGRPTAQRWRAPLEHMFDRLLERARNEDGLWYGRLEASTARVLSQGVPDTWGYGFSAVLSFGLTTGEERYAEAARAALRGVDRERYLEWGGADSFADSIEGALLLLQHQDEPAGWRWLERVLPRFYACQRLPAEGGTGIVEGWYGDGNYARTALMVAFAYSQGAFVEPWTPSVALGGARDAEALVLVLAAEERWSGRLRLDHPRHRDHLRLPVDRPRLNSFPQWFSVEAAELYRVRDADGARPDELRSGEELLAGLPLELAAGETRRLVVEPLGPPPYGGEGGPADPLAQLAEGGDPALLAHADLDGGERYLGESYRWTGRTPIDWRPETPGGPVDATLWLRWGAKGDLRSGRVVIGEHAVHVARGGYDGFDWVAVDVPAEWWPPDGALAVRVEPPAAGPAAFVSALRLRRLGGEHDGAALWFETEGLAGSWREQTNVTGYSGPGFRVSNASGVATDALTTDLPLPAGRYAVWLRGYEGDSGSQAQDRRFTARLGGVALATTHRGRAAGVDDAPGFSWQLAGVVELPAGLHRFELLDAGLGFEVADAVWVTADLGFDPGAAERVDRALLAEASAADLVPRLVEETSARAEESHRRVAVAARDAATWPREREALRRALQGRLGLEPPPPRTPLRARTTGVLERDGYRVEKIVFESRPGFPVTANVYVPAASPHADAAGRLPAVLCPEGHWGAAKAEPVVQARCIGLAKLGYLVLTYDPFGQGERAVEGNEHGEYARAILVGWNNPTLMVWDTLRALDYLLERGDVDPARVACTGASGGGLNTVYAAALDERIAVSVPVVYVTRLREFLETRHTHCPCSHVNGLAEVLDLGDVAGLAAPRPQLVLTASDDSSFTPAGARAAVDQARVQYATAGAPDALVLAEFPGPHDYGRPMREALYAFLAEHLLGGPPGVAVPEPELAPEPDPAALACFPAGRVPATAGTVRSLARARAEELAAALPQTTRLRSGAAPPSPVRPRPLDAGLTALRRRLGPGSAGLPVAFESAEGLRFVGRRGGAPPTARRNGPLVVVLADGPDAPARSAALLRAAESQGAGWVQLSESALGDGGRRHLLATDAHLAGDPLLWRRARATAGLLAALRAEDGGARPVVAVADGLAPGLALLLASAARAEGAPPPADALALRDLPASLVALFDGPLPPLDAGAWRLLELADVEGLCAAAGVPVVRCAEDGEAPAVLRELLDAAR